MTYRLSGCIHSANLIPNLILLESFTVCNMSHHEFESLITIMNMSDKAEQLYARNDPFKAHLKQYAFRDSSEYTYTCRNHRKGQTSRTLFG